MTAVEQQLMNDLDSLIAEDWIRVRCDASDPAMPM
jgi:hypothetical protein